MFVGKIGIGKHMRVNHIVNRTVFTWPWPDDRIFYSLGLLSCFYCGRRNMSAGLILKKSWLMFDWWMLRKGLTALSDYSISIVKNKLTFSPHICLPLSRILLSNAKAFKDSLVCSQSVSTPALLLILPHCSPLQSFLLPPFHSSCLLFLFSPLLCSVFLAISVRQDEQILWRKWAFK